MRTMLISLILICSLARLASASAPVLVDSGGCGTTYKCFVPKKCKDPTVTTMADNIVVGIIRANDNKILNDCGAIIRFYRYNEMKTYVSIESFQDTVKKIEFKQENDDRQKVLNFFSCEFDKASGKKKGIFFDKLVLDEVVSPGKLKCTFEDKRKAPHDNDVFMKATDFITIVTYQEDPSTHDLVAAPTENTDLLSNVEVRCDPENLEFGDPEYQQTKLYQKVSKKNKPEKYECDEARFVMEFKRKNSDSYEVVKSIKCVNGGQKFEVTTENDQKDSFEDSVEIRCVAEAKFFCKYLPKVKVNEAAPILEEKPDGNSLKCPPEKPHFVIVGQIDEYLYNPEFQCLAVGVNALWAIVGEKSTEHFTKDGLTVYCTNKLKCEKPISGNIVQDGTLGSNAFPKCFKDGTLKTTDGKLATNFACDTSIGEYKYTAGGAEIHINSSTKFICEYPPEEEPPTFDQETKAKLQTAIIVAIGIGVLAVIGTCVGSCLYMKQKMKRKKKKYMADQLKNVQYMTREEKALIKKNEEAAKKLLKKQNPQQKSGEKSKPVEKEEKDEKMEQKAPVKTNQHQSMTKLGVTINAKDQLTDSKDLKNDGANKYDKRPRKKGLHVPRKTGLYNDFNANREPVITLTKEMDENRKKGKIQADNGC